MKLIASNNYSSCLDTLNYKAFLQLVRHNSCIKGLILTKDIWVYNRNTGYFVVGARCYPDCQNYDEKFKIFLSGKYTHNTKLSLQDRITFLPFFDLNNNQQQKWYEINNDRTEITIANLYQDSIYYDKTLTSIDLQYFNIKSNKYYYYGIKDIKNIKTIKQLSYNVQFCSNKILLCGKGFLDTELSVIITFEGIGEENNAFSATTSDMSIRLPSKYWLYTADLPSLGPRQATTNKWITFSTNNAHSTNKNNNHSPARPLWQENAPSIVIPTIKDVSVKITTNTTPSLEKPTNLIVDPVIQTDASTTNTNNQAAPLNAQNWVQPEKTERKTVKAYDEDAFLRRLFPKLNYNYVQTRNDPDEPLPKIYRNTFTYTGNIHKHHNKILDNSTSLPQYEL